MSILAKLHVDNNSTGTSIVECRVLSPKPYKGYIRLVELKEPLPSGSLIVVLDNRLKYE